MRQNRHCFKRVRLAVNFVTAGFALGEGKRPLDP
jgi:hypothetical protein